MRATHVFLTRLCVYVRVWHSCVPARLDIELGRLEFLVHPAMGQEDLLVCV